MIETVVRAPGKDAPRQGRRPGELLRWRELLWQLTLRDVQGRFRGTYLGVAWAVLLPLASIAVLTFVGSGVFKVRWGGSGPARPADYALGTFSGLIAFNLFVEVVTRSPVLITGNRNYVRRVRFPLGLLSVSLTSSALIHACISLGLFLAGSVLLRGSIPSTAWLLPLAALPLLLLSLGTSWILSSLGVLVRDIGQLAGTLVTFLFFLTPITYPLSAAPASARKYLQLNPLLHVVEAFRDMLFRGEVPRWDSLLAVTAFSLVYAVAGYLWFEKTRPVFADLV